MPILRRSLASSFKPKEGSQTGTLPDASAPDEVYYCHSTGEFFFSYEDYLERLALYNQPVWTCRLTGHAGMRYQEALASEETARRSLEALQEWWRPYAVYAIHCSTEAMDVLVARIVHYFKTHLVLNEPVRMPFNDSLYDGTVSGAPGYETIDLAEASNEEALALPDHSMTAIYRISINQGDMIMTGACCAPSDVIKGLLKKFVRSVAVRYGHAGSPWIVHEDVLSKYAVKKKLAPEMADRVRLLVMLREKKDKDLKKRASASKETLVKAEEEAPLKYPILDEFVPAARQTDPLLWPSPKEFNPALSIVAAGMIPQILELWQFLHTFGTAIQMHPPSLEILLSALEHDGEHNPLLETLCASFLNHFTKNIRSAKTKEERISQYLGAAPVADLPAFSTKRVSHAFSEQPEDTTVDLLGDSTRLEDLFAGVSKREASHWSWKVLQFLWDIRKIPEAGNLLHAMQKKGIHQFCNLSGAEKLTAITILMRFYMTCVSLRPIVDKEVEIAAGERHKIRECEAERRKLNKDEQEMRAEHEEASRQLEQDNNPAETVKQLRKTLRSLDMCLGKIHKAQTKLTHDIQVAQTKMMEHSAPRISPLGEDRFGRRYWWMDWHLVRPAARSTAASILLVELPSAPHWAYYDEEEQIDGLIAFLNPLGSKEARLGARLTLHRDAIVKGLASFPHGKATDSGVPKAAAEYTDEGSEEEDMPVVTRRRSAKRRAVEEPAFLRYRNTFKGR